MNLPQKETDLDDLTAQQIIDKINAFYQRFMEVNFDMNEIAESEFLQALASYPVSMCSYNMTETLKLVIALAYFGSKPTEKELAEESDPWEGYSYEDLAFIFDRSKASISEAIKKKESEAKAIIEEANLHEKAKSKALEELIQEEKLKLRQNRQSETKTTERTDYKQSGEDIVD